MVIFAFCPVTFDLFAAQFALVWKAAHPPVEEPYTAPLDS
jgi:hypothetical protein